MMRQCREKIDAFRLEVIPAQLGLRECASVIPAPAGVRQRAPAHMSFPRKRESRNMFSDHAPNEIIG